MVMRIKSFSVKILAYSFIAQHFMLKHKLSHTHIYIVCNRFDDCPTTIELCPFQTRMTTRTRMARTPRRRGRGSGAAPCVRGRASSTTTATSSRRRPPPRAYCAAATRHCSRPRLSATVGRPSVWPAWSRSYNAQGLHGYCV